MFLPAGCSSEKWGYFDALMVTTLTPLFICVLAILYFYIRREQRRRIFYDLHPHYVEEHEDEVRRLDILEIQKNIQKSSTKKAKPDSPDKMQAWAERWSYNEEVVAKGIKGYSKSGKTSKVTPLVDDGAVQTPESSMRKTMLSTTKNYISKMTPLSLKNALDAVASPLGKHADEDEHDGKDADADDKPKTWTEIHFPLLHGFSDNDIAHMSTLTELEKTERKRLATFVKYILMAAYMIQPLICMKLFGAFQCVDVPIDLSGVAPRYLRADLSVSCDTPEYRSGAIFAAFMCFVYPIGVTTLYFVLLYRARSLIQHRAETKDDSQAELADETEDILDVYTTKGERNKVINEKYRVQRETEHELMKRNMDTSHHTTVLLNRMKGTQGGRSNQLLYHEMHQQYEHIAPMGEFEFEVMHYFYEAYKPQYWYWDVIEMIRRITISAALAIVFRGTRVQILFGFMIAVAFFWSHCYAQPYTDAITNNLAKAGHFQHMSTLFIALLVRNRAAMKPDFPEYMAAYDIILCFINCSVFVGILYLIVRRDVKRLLLGWAEKNGYDDFARLIRGKARVVEKTSSAMELVETPKRRKKENRSSIRGLKREYEFGPAFTYRFNEGDLREDIKHYFLYLHSAISHVYTYVLHEKRMISEIISRGFYAQSSDEEDSEPEFVPETEETWLENADKTRDFVESHLLWTTENTDAWDDAGWCDVIISEIVHEIESELMSQIFREDIQAEIQSMVEELVGEWTPDINTVTKRALAGSVIKEKPVKVVEPDPVSPAIFQEFDAVEGVFTFSQKLSVELEDTNKPKLKRRLNYDMSSSSSEGSDEESHEVVLHRRKLELEKMEHEDARSSAVRSEHAHKTMTKAERLEAKKKRLLKEKKEALAQSMTLQKRSEKAAKREADRIQREEEERVEQEKARKEAAWQLFLEKETKAEKKIRLEKEKLLAQAQKRIEAAKKKLELEAAKKAAAKEKERLKNAALKEKEEKRKAAEIERLAKKKKDEEEKKRVAEAKKAATAEKLKQRLEREKARMEARKAATDKLLKERTEKDALKLSKLHSDGSTLASTAALSDTEKVNNTHVEEDKDSEPSVIDPNDLEVSDIGSVSDSEEEEELRKEAEARKKLASESPLKRCTMKTGISLLKMAGKKVMLTNTLGLNESVIKARAEARTMQEAAVDQRRKEDEETLRTKSIKDALRREKMADLERNFEPLNVRYSEVKQTLAEKNRALLKPKKEEHIRLQLAEDLAQLEPEYMAKKAELDLLQAEEDASMAVETELMARLNESFKEKQALAARRKRAAERQKLKIAKMVEEDRAKQASLLKDDESAQLRKKMWEIEQARLKAEEGLSNEEKARRRERLEKKARLKIKARKDAEERLRAAAQAEEERRQRLEEERKAAHGITADLVSTEEAVVDKDKTKSVAEMADIKRRKEEKEKKERHLIAKHAEAAKTEELTSKKEKSRSFLLKRLETRKSFKLDAAFVDSESEVDTPTRAPPPAATSTRVLTAEEKRLDEINHTAALAAQRREIESKEEEEAGRSNTKRRLEVKQRKKKVKKRFAGVISRVKLMAKLGATFDHPIEEEPDDDDDATNDNDHGDRDSSPSPDETSASEVEERTPGYRATTEPGTPSMYSMSPGDTDVSDVESSQFKSPLSALHEEAHSPSSASPASAAPKSMYVLSPDRESDFDVTSNTIRAPMTVSSVQDYDLSDEENDHHSSASPAPKSMYVLSPDKESDLELTPVGLSTSGSAHYHHHTPNTSATSVTEDHYDLTDSD